MPAHRFRQIVGLPARPALLAAASSLLSHCHAQVVAGSGTPVDLGLGPGGLNFSDDDVANNKLLSDWFGEAFHSEWRIDGKRWARAYQELSDLAGAPELSFAIGSALYAYFWWDDSTRSGVNIAAGRTAANLLHHSIEHQACNDVALSVDEFLQRLCHMRWRQLLLLSAETARHLVVDLLDVQEGARVLREATVHFEQVRKMPFFRQLTSLGTLLQRPHDMNYNMDYYPHTAMGPIWPRLPLATFLEAHFAEFREDLEGIMDAGTFWRLHAQAFVAETQFAPRDDDWQTVYLFLNGAWVSANCAAAPRSCELLRERPELAGCKAKSAGAGFLRLQPGARLKPHYGNGPRLSAHLGLVVPEAGDIHMHVGSETVRWEEGRAVIFDDTYIHRVVHDGDKPRFVLLLWFCHPCDSENWENPPEQQLPACRWPR